MRRASASRMARRAATARERRDWTCRAGGGWRRRSPQAKGRRSSGARSSFAAPGSGGAGHLPSRRAPRPQPHGRDVHGSHLPRRGPIPCCGRDGEPGCDRLAPRSGTATRRTDPGPGASAGRARHGRARPAPRPSAASRPPRIRPAAPTRRGRLRFTRTANASRLPSIACSTSSLTLPPRDGDVRRHHRGAWRPAVCSIFNVCSGPREARGQRVGHEPRARRGVCALR